MATVDVVSLEVLEQPLPGGVGVDHEPFREYGEGRAPNGLHETTVVPQCPLLEGRWWRVVPQAVERWRRCLRSDGRPKARHLAAVQ